MCVRLFSHFVRFFRNPYILRHHFFLSKPVPTQKRGSNITFFIIKTLVMLVSIPALQVYLSQRYRCQKGKVVTQNIRVANSSTLYVCSGPCGGPFVIFLFWGKERMSRHVWILIKFVYICTHQRTYSVYIFFWYIYLFTLSQDIHSFLYKTIHIHFFLNVLFLPPSLSLRSQIFSSLLGWFLSGEEKSDNRKTPSPQNRDVAFSDF